MPHSVAPQQKTMTAMNWAIGSLTKQDGDDGLPDQLRHVDDRPEPAELLAPQVRVGDEAEDGRVGQRGLVERLQAVDDEDDGQDGQIDLAQNALVVGRRDDDVLSSFLQQVSGFVSASNVRVRVGHSFYCLRMDVAWFLVASTPISICTSS